MISLFLLVFILKGFYQLVDFSGFFLVQMPDDHIDRQINSQDRQSKRERVVKAVKDPGV